MAEISGKEGSVALVGGVVIHAKSWTISYVAEELETTAFGDTARTYIGGFKGATGSYECWLDDLLANKLIAPGGAAALGTFVYATAAGNRQLSGNVVVTSIEPAVAIDGSSRGWTCNFRFTGAVTIG